MTPQLIPLEPSGIRSERKIIDFGFDYKIYIDPQNNELYYKLYVDNKYVGDTEYNDNFDEYEIICYDLISYEIVISIVKNKVNVWAWFNNIFTSVN